MTDSKLNNEESISSEQLAFAVFCIENLAERLHTSAPEIYHTLTENRDILYNYIIPCYDVLHTQDKEYILDDIEDVMRAEGAL